MPARPIAIAIAAVLAVASCSDTPHPVPPRRLALRNGDLGSRWTPFTPLGKPLKIDICGNVFHRAAPMTSSFATAWRRSPLGPIVGERVERYADNRSADSVLRPTRGLHTPCNFESTDGRRWHTRHLRQGSATRSELVFLITSRDRSDSFNYEITLRDGPTLARLVVQSHQANPELMNHVISIAWHRLRREPIGTPQ